MWELLLGWIIFCFLIVSFWHFCCVRECICLRNWLKKRREEREKKQQQKLGNGIINDGFDERKERMVIFSDGNFVDLECGQRGMGIQENGNGASTHSGMENLPIHHQNQRINELHQNAPKSGWRRPFPPLPHFSLLPDQSPSNNGQQNQNELRNNDEEREEDSGSIATFHSALSDGCLPSHSSNSPKPWKSREELPPAPINNKFLSNGCLPWHPSSNSLISLHSQEKLPSAPAEELPPAPKELPPPAPKELPPPAPKELPPPAPKELPPPAPTNKDWPCYSQTGNVSDNEDEENQEWEEKEPNANDEDSFESMVKKFGGLPRKVVNLLEWNWPNREDRKKQCKICLEYFVYNKPVTKSDCDELLHYKCLAEWFLQCRACPVCKKLCWLQKEEKKVDEMDGNEKK